MLAEDFGTIMLSTGSFAQGLLIISGIAVGRPLMIRLVQGQWKQAWIGEDGGIKARSVGHETGR